MANDVRPVDANELLKESIYCREEDGSNVYAVPVGKIFAAPTLNAPATKPVSIVREKAHWKPKDNKDPFLAVRFECSHCGCEISNDWDYEPPDDMWNYCPSCGRKMDGEEDG